MAWIIFIIAVVLIYRFLKSPATSSSGHNAALSRGGKMERRKGVIMLRPINSLYDPVAAVGESFYRDNLREIESKFGRDVIATLVPESDNEHDENAIKVEIAGKKVAHLSKSDAKKFRKTHAMAIADGRPIDCYAELKGRSNSEQGLGVFLNFTMSSEIRYKKDPK